MQLYMVEWFRTDHHEKGVSFHSLWQHEVNAKSTVAAKNADLEKDPYETARLRVVPVKTQD